MNKLQLQDRARELGISFEESDTKKVLEAKIAEKTAEQEGVDVKPTSSIITTSTITAPKEEENGEEEEPLDPEPVVTEPVEEKKGPEKDDETTLYKYVGAASSYQISKYKFTEKDPFVVVDNEFAEKNLQDNPDVVKSSSDEAKEFYGE